MSSQRGGKLSSVSRGNPLNLSALKFTPLDQTMDSDDEDKDNSGSSLPKRTKQMIGDPADICSSDKAKTTRPVTNRARHLPLELTPKSSPTPSTKIKNRHRFRGSSPTLAYGFGKKLQEGGSDNGSIEGRPTYSYFHDESMPTTPATTPPTSPIVKGDR